MNATSATTPIYFSLTPYLYAATFDNAIIILDGKADKYLSLIDDAATFFRLILKQQFIKHHDGSYRPLNTDQANHHDDYNYWITYFLDKQFITYGMQPTHLQAPLKAGGLIGYRWDTKKQWSPFSTASMIDIAKAFWILARVHRTINKKGMLGVINLIQKNTAHKNPSIPSEKHIEKLSASVDAASLLYPAKTLCLAWAATFVILALRKGWKINFVIGVQTNPFYAHAWAETISGTVINDDPLITQTLAIILKTPYQQKDH